MEDLKDTKLCVFSRKKQEQIRFDKNRLLEQKKVAILEGENLLGWMNHGGWSKQAGW